MGGWVAVGQMCAAADECMVALHALQPNSNHLSNDQTGPLDPWTRGVGDREAGHREVGDRQVGYRKVGDREVKGKPGKVLGIPSEYQRKTRRDIRRGMGARGGERNEGRGKE